MTGKRYAVFVDVGYLAAAGQWAVNGQWRPRNSFLMDASKAVSAILGEASRQLEGRELLRLYWYDAAPGRLPTAEQQAVAELDDVAVRLGDLSSRGVQKGVDSLIVLDMYDAATQQPIIASAPLVLGQDLLEPYNFGVGSIFCVDTTGHGLDAGPDDLGERVKVYWFSPDEVIA